MSAIDTLEKLTGTSLIFEDLRYCLVDASKRPFTIKNEMAAVNNKHDFVELERLFECDKLSSYAGVGISVQASEVCAVDIDQCVKQPFDESTISDFAKEIIEMFKQFAYIEYSFSGTGIRILFKQKSVDDYSKQYKIKNSKIHLEYYQPNHSNRYVTVTGKYLFDNPLTSDESNFEIVIEFLETYMKKQIRKREKVELSDDSDLDELMKKVKYHYFKSHAFQDLWFTHAPGSGKDESERDYRLLRYLYINITQDRDKLKELFELSEFFKTKDKKHIFKWERNEYRYFDYMFNHIKEEYS